MLKKTFISSIIFLSATSTVFAKSTSYVGGSLSIPTYSQLNGLSGLGASLYGGKGWLVGLDQKFYFGGELGMSTNFRPNVIGGYASFIPGLMITKDTMIYTRLGLSGDYYHYNYHYRAHHQSSTSGVAFNTQVGLGVQTKIAQHWDVRIEGVANGGYKPNQLNLGFVYKFD